ncbi:hypothetical protein AURDEDRAFT_177412 [Auricularia subglabra TFB-10046 SS5]|uniref:Uncharacterized protein n=1 Tax=Auricularia subglabra (strain TFB-10046 / SS5) TaxID=717982 RepID=J0CT88_AURST|nr:hypothetical protein AURDEDRAFT_177412 [Auricularia subglabra TFB-10046 SS5]
MDHVHAVPDAIPETISQDATCARCNRKHKTYLNGHVGPREFWGRMVIWCPQQGYVARMNHTTLAMEVMCEHVGYVHLSPPPRAPPRGRPGRLDWRGGIAPRQAPLAVAPPRPAPPALVAVAARAENVVVTISLEMTNQHTTYTVDHLIPLLAFDLILLPDNVRQRLHYADIVDGTAEVLLHNHWNPLVIHRSLDISSIRAQSRLNLRAVSRIFPLRYACDMADGLRRFALYSEEDPDASPAVVFEKAFNGTPWPGPDALFDAQRLWEALPRKLRQRYSACDRTDEFTWSRVVGAADAVRYSSPPAESSAEGSRKRKRKDSGKQDMHAHAPQRGVKRERAVDKLPPRKRTIVDLSSSDDEIEFIAHTPARDMKREPVAAADAVPRREPQAAPAGNLAADDDDDVTVLGSEPVDA